MDKRTAMRASSRAAGDRSARTGSHASNAASIGLGELARLMRLPLSDGPVPEEPRFPLRSFGAGEALYRAGDPFQSIYAVRAGFFKVVAVDNGGAERVLAFPMTGDALGVDGIESGAYQADAIALEAAQVAVLSLGKLAQAARESLEVERFVFRILSREVTRNAGTMQLLGTLGAQERVAAFLLSLAERYGGLGYSRAAFNLRMTRAELGGHLGLTLETVSRALSAFVAGGLIEVRGRAVVIKDPGRLQALVDGPGREPLSPRAPPAGYPRPGVPNPVAAGPWRQLASGEDGQDQEPVALSVRP
jgi:CRP/FNR family transcriptional regulator